MAPSSIRISAARYASLTINNVGHMVKYSSRPNEAQHSINVLLLNVRHKRVRRRELSVTAWGALCIATFIIMCMETSRQRVGDGVCRDISNDDKIP